MKQTALLIAVLLFVSCAGPSASLREKPSAESSQVLADLRVSGPLQDLPLGEKIRVESAARRIVAAGDRMVDPLLAAIEDTREPESRMVLIRVLSLVLDSFPSDRESNKVYYDEVAKAGRRLLGSTDASDRQAGLLLTSLPRRTRLTEASIEMLEDSDEGNRNIAATLLVEIAQVDFGYDPSAAASDRKPAVKRWKSWWRRNKSRTFYSTPMANPLLQGFRAESLAVSRQAGPYSLEVTDPEGKPIEGAVIAYSYYFGTPDGIGKQARHQGVTDSAGKVLLAVDRFSAGLRFLRGDVLVSKLGYAKRPLAILPNLLTPNSFYIQVSIEPAKAE